MTIGVVEQSFTSTGQTEGLAINDDFNVSVDFTTGSGVGTIVLERSFDGGVTFKPGAVKTYTSDTEEAESFPEDIQFRLRCSVFTSGIIAVRLSY